jgi:hypothetical protein
MTRLDGSPRRHVERFTPCRGLFVEGTAWTSVPPNYGRGVGVRPGSKQQGGCDQHGGHHVEYETVDRG